MCLRWEELTGHHDDDVRERERVVGALGLASERKVRIVCTVCDRKNSV